MCRATTYSVLFLWKQIGVFRLNEYAVCDYMRGRLWVDTMLVGWIESVSDSLTSIIGHYTFATTVHVYWFILIILQKTRIALSLNKHRNFTCSRSVSSIYIQFVKDMWRTCVFFREKRGKNRIHSRSSQQTVHFTNVFPFTVVFCVASPSNFASFITTDYPLMLLIRFFHLSARFRMRSCRYDLLDLMW